MAARPEVVFGALDARFPFRTACDWDNSGWQVHPEGPIHRCLVALDPSPETAAEAIARGAGLILTHHPLFFPHLKTLDSADRTGRVVRPLLENGIGLLAVHTPADRTLAGISGALAERLGLGGLRLLQPEEDEVLYKLAVFVPPERAGALREALTAAGAGRIGAYEACSFTLPGTGSYRPRAGARPFQGEVGRLEEVAELRLEMRVPEPALEDVLAAMRAAHPYEEVAFDLFRTHRQGEGLGLGAVGEWAAPLGVPEALEKIKEALGGVPLRVTGPTGGEVARVAVMGGSADHLVGRALEVGAQLFVGGDLKYHTGLDAAERLVCVDPGHRASELPGLERLARVLREASDREGWDIEVELYLEEPGHARVV
jgi:dinuclear metal center YbgI/SA1388 family protein